MIFSHIFIPDENSDVGEESLRDRLCLSLSFLSISSVRSHDFLFFTLSETVKEFDVRDAAADVDTKNQEGPPASHRHSVDKEEVSRSKNNLFKLPPPTPPTPLGPSVT